MPLKIPLVSFGEESEELKNKVSNEKFPKKSYLPKRIKKYFPEIVLKLFRI